RPRAAAVCGPRRPSTADPARAVAAARGVRGRARRCARRAARGAPDRRRGRRPRCGPRRRCAGRPRGDRVRRLALACAVALAGCPGGSSRSTTPIPEPEATGEDPATRLANLADDILASYERDDPPDIDSGMIDPKVGAARIGAGPGDVYFAGDLK